MTAAVVGFIEVKCSNLFSDIFVHMCRKRGGGGWGGGAGAGGGAMLPQ